jgi:hypothetical protein
MRFGEMQPALDQAVYALNLAPFSVPAYMQLGDVFLHSARAEDAAVTLMEGEIVTKDPILTEQLVRLYRSGLDPQGCAVVKNQGQWTLNLSCEVVRRHICKAWAGAENIYTQAGHPDLAASARGQLSTLACP